MVNNIKYFSEIKQKWNHKHPRNKLNLSQFKQQGYTIPSNLHLTRVNGNWHITKVMKNVQTQQPISVHWGVRHNQSSSIGRKKINSWTTSNSDDTFDHLLVNKRMKNVYKFLMKNGNYESTQHIINMLNAANRTQDQLRRNRENRERSMQELALAIAQQQHYYNSASRPLNSVTQNPEKPKQTRQYMRSRARSRARSQAKSQEKSQQKSSNTSINEEYKRRVQPSLNAIRVVKEYTKFLERQRQKNGIISDKDYDKLRTRQNNRTMKSYNQSVSKVQENLYKEVMKNENKFRRLLAQLNFNQFSETLNQQMKNHLRKNV